MSKKNRRPSTFVSAGAQPTRTEFNPDYSNVKKDLGRIGVLAAAFFIGLIVLSFFIK
jgi:hypothetical protein